MPGREQRRAKYNYACTYVHTYFGAVRRRYWRIRLRENLEESNFQVCGIIALVFNPSFFIGTSLKSRAMRLMSTYI